LVGVMLEAPGADFRFEPVVGSQAGNGTHSVLAAGDNDLETASPVDLEKRRLSRIPAVAPTLPWSQSPVGRAIQLQTEIEIQVRIVDRDFQVHRGPRTDGIVQNSIQMFNINRGISPTRRASEE